MVVSKPKIRVHYPTTEEGKRMLEERIADLHVRMIVRYIENLPWEADEKITLFNMIKEDAMNRAMAN